MNIGAVFKTVKAVLTESRYLRLLKKPVVKGSSFDYCGQNGCVKELARREYITARSPLPDYFIKRKVQTVICVFTPGESRFIGSAQRTLLMSDYIIFENREEKELTAKLYRLDGIYQGTILIGSRERLTQQILSGQTPTGEKIFTDRRRLLLYTGSLAQNGLTASLLNLLSCVRDDEPEIWLTWREDSLVSSPERIDKIPGRFGNVPIHGRTVYSAAELLCYILRFKLGIEAGFVQRRLDALYKREWHRLFGWIRLSCVVHFTGYEYGMISLFRAFEGRRVIYVHNNMKEEIRLRKNQNEAVLRQAYSEFEVTALVTEDMRESAMEISRGKGSMQVVRNCHDYKGVIEKSRQPVEFQDKTDSNITVDRLVNLLNDSSRLKFITIGRFSSEKAHMRLIDAFEDYCREYDDTSLIIIGGRGELYGETLRRAQRSDADITVIRSMENPMPVLRRCSLFMLPSLYEGLGLALLEADTLGVPVFATDIPGPRGFMGEHGGYLAENSRMGILGAMKAYRKGLIQPMNVDYEAYNKTAAEQFYKAAEGGQK